jgi:NitT/TauT family transport system substrate-binding protein
MLRWSKPGGALAALVVLLVTACGPTSGGSAPAKPAASAPAASVPAAPAAQNSAPAPVAALPKVRAAWTSDTAAELPLQVAREAGLFEQYGLDVSADRLAGGSSKVMQVMLAGELDLAQIGGTAVVDAYLAGADPVYLAAHNPVLVMQMFAVPGVARVEDLRGKSLAVTRAGTISDFAGRYALTKAGLRADADVGIIQTGGNTETLAAMQSNNVQAGMVSPPVDVPARKLGFTEIVDPASLGVDFPHDGLAARRDFLVANPEAVQRFMRAYVAAIARIKQDKAFTKQVMAKYLETTDDEALESGYAAFGEKFIARAPYPTAAQFQSIIDFVAERDPHARDLPLERMLDDRFVRALDQEGFIDSLYR